MLNSFKNRFRIINPIFKLSFRISNNKWNNLNSISNIIVKAHKDFSKTLRAELFLTTQWWPLNTLQSAILPNKTTQAITISIEVITLQSASQLTWAYNKIKSLANLTIFPIIYKNFKKERSRASSKVSLSLKVKLGL